MKNAQKFVFRSFVLFLLLIFTACVENKQEPCPACPCSDLTDENYDEGIIFPDEARKLYVNYENRRVNLIQDYEDSIDEEKRDPKKQQQMQQDENTDANGEDPNGPKFDVARYVFYDYKDLKKYMAYIENEAKLSGEDLSTLRFYFANYPDEEKFPDGKPVVHRRQNSIMMSPTVKRDGKEHIFYTTDGTDGKRKIVLLENDFKRRGADDSKEASDEKSEASLVPNLFSAPTPMYAEKSTTKNEGHSAPPPY